MAVHRFYLGWQVEYDYFNSKELTEKRTQLLKLLHDNGFDTAFVNLWNSEQYLHDNEGIERKLQQKRKRALLRGEDGRFISSVPF